MAGAARLQVLPLGATHTLQICWLPQPGSRGQHGGRLWQLRSPGQRVIYAGHAWIQVAALRL